MWAEIGPWYREILDLPFNRELAAGTLGRDRFVHYMIQDAHYLGLFARALAAVAAKAPGADGQIRFANASAEAIVVERALHEGFFAEFGVSPERFAAEPPSPTCAAYGDFLLATALAAPFGVGVAALVPCFQIYYEVGKHLYGVAAPSNPYQKWIDTYRDEGFGDAVRAVLAQADAAHARAGGAERQEMRAAYLKAARYEWMFWDAAWRRETWPLT
jgi:thiaminase/transcriptional activator TenA